MRAGAKRGEDEAEDWMASCAARTSETSESDVAGRDSGDGLFSRRRDGRDKSVEATVGASGWAGEEVEEVEEAWS